ncbi:hypothetical protein Tco_0282490 [Tanacetum coccineum]
MHPWWWLSDGGGFGGDGSGGGGGDGCVMRVFWWPPVGREVAAGGDMPAVVAAKVVGRVMVACSGSSGVVGCASAAGRGGRGWWPTGVVARIWPEVFQWPPVGGGVEAGGDVPAVVAAKLVARVMVTCSGSGGVVGCASTAGGGGRGWWPAGAVAGIWPEVGVRTYLLGGAIDGSEANGIIRDPKLELESSRFTFDLVPLSYESVDVVVGENWLLRHKAEMVCHEKVVKMPCVPKELVGFTPRHRIGFRMELVQGETPICEGSCRLTYLERQEVWNDCRSCKVRVGSNGNLLWEASALLGTDI